MLDIQDFLDVDRLLCRSEIATLGCPSVNLKTSDILSSIPQNHTALICMLWEILDVTDKTWPHCVMRLRMQDLSCLVQL